MPNFKPDQQDLARRKGHGAGKVHDANADLIRTLNRQTVQTTAGTITWIVDPGDHLTLRGIPAIGRSVRGAIHGSIPGQHLDE